MSRTGKHGAKAAAKKPAEDEPAGESKKAGRRSKEEKVSPVMLEAAYHVKDFMTDNQKALAYLKAGKQMHDRGAYRWAVECFTEGISCNPSSSLFNARAASYKNLNMWSEAYFDYSFAIRMEPDSGPFHCSRGMVLAKMKRWQLALEDCELATELSSTPFHHYCKATVLADSGRNMEAIEDLQYCLNFDACPQDLKYKVHSVGNALVLFAFVLLCVCAPRFRKYNILTILHAFPYTHPQKAWYRSGLCQFDLGLYPEAVKSLQTLINIDANAVAPRALLARSMKMMADLVQAESQISLVIASEPTAHQHLIERGDILFRTNNSNKCIEAIYDFDSAISLLQAQVEKTINEIDHNKREDQVYFAQASGG